MAKRKKRRRQQPPRARPEAAPPVAPSGAAGSRSSSRRVALAAAIAVAAVAAVVVAVVLTRGSSQTATSSSPAPPAATTTAPVSTTAAGRGPLPARRLFAVYCGLCHTLADAGAVGDDGPNLDRLAPTKARVLAAIRRGGRGSGEMPAGIFTGRNAARVAAYVARATHRR